MRTDRKSVVRYPHRSYNAVGRLSDPLNTLMRLESLLEGLAERSFARLFRARMQPIEIAKRLTREMEAGRIVGVSSVLVPNRFRVALNPADFAAFSPIRSSLEQEMTQYLITFAREHGYGTTARPEVEILEAPAVRPGRMIVAAQLTEPRQDDVNAYTQPDAARPTERLESTRMMPRPAVPRAPAQRLFGEASLTVGDTGTTYSLSGDDVALGRGLENSIVLEDRRVSRSHARLVCNGGEWVVRDEGSTNGTFVNGHMVSQQGLFDGDLLSLGGLELVFHQRQE